MPVVSIDLSQDLEDIKEKAKERVLKALVENKPLGDEHSWEEVHKERSEEDRD
jgi:hypothetical protein